MSENEVPASLAKLINAPAFSDDTVGRRQRSAWQRMAQDIHKSTSVEDLLQARSKAEGYILGLVDAGHLSSRDMERDYVILSLVQRRKEFLTKLLCKYGY